MHRKKERRSALSVSCQLELPTATAVFTIFNYFQFHYQRILIRSSSNNYLFIQLESDLK